MSASFTLAMAACGEAPTPGMPAAEPRQLSSGIAFEYMDESIRPGDDFFGYVNGKWIAETEIPADKSRYGVVHIVVDQVDEHVRAIIEESAAGEFAMGSDEQKVGDLYQSYLDMDTRNARGVEPLQPALARIDSIASLDDLASYFGWSIKRGYRAPFSMGQFADYMDPRYYMIYVEQGGLGLPDRQYYLDDDEKSAEIRDQYRAHVARMFELAGLPGGDDAAQTVMDLERRLAERHLRKEVTRNPSELYSKVPTGDLPTVMPSFNWDLFLAEIGLADLDAVVFFTGDYINNLDGIITGTDIETWRTYLTWALLDSTAGRLTAELDGQDFEFRGRILSGAEQQQEMWRRGVNLVNRTVGEAVGKVYVGRHFPPEAKERMLDLVGNLLGAYEVSIRELDWMSEETRAAALEKLSKFTAKIGYPDVWRSYDALEIRPDDLFGNLERAALAEHDRRVERQGGPVDRSEWGLTPQTVNAFYASALNEIVFPAAILQPPFFNLEADDAVNYGAIGAIIGHEIGHGFDDNGSNFDGDGVLRNWWTEEDRAEFKKRTAKLIEQFSAYQVFDDLNVNGEYTLGENIGDLGGISIGLLAYKLSLDGEEAPVIDGLTGIQRVFLGNGQVWRSKAREEWTRYIIASDTHAPARFRANGAVRNVPEFYEAFEISEDDALYLPPEERVKIW